MFSCAGLLVKQMLVDACDKPELEQLVENSHGVVFFSTPHHGTSLAALSQKAQSLLYPTVEVQDLSQGMWSRPQVGSFLIKSLYSKIALKNFIGIQFSID